MELIARILLLLCLTFSAQITSAQQIIRTPVTDAEITALGEELWRLDTNNVANLITIETQNGATRDGNDNAPRPLLTVPASVYQKPTISKLIPLYDNYVAATNKPEVVTPQETAEEVAFLDAVLATPVMKKVEDFLTTKRYIINRRIGSQGQVQINKNAFRNEMSQIWFGIFPRERNINSSSGFEHVFLGETQDGAVHGLHNWIFFSKQEANRALNYLGHIRIIGLGNKGKVMKMTFTWNGMTKPSSGMLVGTSPEFEMAIYTICFYARPGGNCPITLNGKSVPFVAYSVNRNGKKFLSTAYPKI